jgi:ATP-dependent exoDNAse (exonuclease V) beta subunit
VEILRDDEGDGEERGWRRWSEWRDERERITGEGGVALHDVVVVTELDEGPAEPGPIASEAVSRTGERPGGRRFGTLVHTLLRDVALDASDEEIEHLARLQAAMLDAPDSERDAAAAAVGAALRHPLFERARNAQESGGLLREAPFVLPLVDGRLLEGTVDLAFEEAGRTVVVDYKTDADLAENRSRYEAQLGWYVFALERVLGRPAEGVLLSV